MARESNNWLVTYVYSVYVDCHGVPGQGGIDVVWSPFQGVREYIYSSVRLSYPGHSPLTPPPAPAQETSLFPGCLK